MSASPPENLNAEIKRLLASIVAKDAASSCLLFEHRLRLVSHSVNRNGISQSSNPAGRRGNGQSLHVHHYQNLAHVLQAGRRATQDWIIVLSVFSFRNSDHGMHSLPHLRERSEASVILLTAGAATRQPGPLVKDILSFVCVQVSFTHLV